MIIQAIPILTVNPSGNQCAGTISFGTPSSVHYSIGGTTGVNGQTQSVVVQGLLRPSACVSVSLPAMGSYVVRMDQGPSTGSGSFAASATLTSQNVLVTYGYLSAAAQMGAFLIVRTLP